MYCAEPLEAEQLDALGRVARDVASDVRSPEQVGASAQRSTGRSAQVLFGRGAVGRGGGIEYRHERRSVVI